MKKYEIIFNDGAFSRTVTAKNKESALNKAISRLTAGQRNNYHNWVIVLLNGDDRIIVEK